MGYSYDVLNYYSEEQELKFSFWGHTQYMNWKYRIAKKVLYPIRQYQLNQILSFQRQFTSLSQRYLTYEELKTCADKYDVFITGSDQVWNNQEINHFDDSYFLSFAKDKNSIAYAASFGKTITMLTEKDKAFYKRNIPLVKHISVREKSAIEIVRNLTGDDAKWVCDPVFLLSREQWDNYIKKPKISKYILVYLVGDGINFDVNKEIVLRARAIGKKLNKKIVVVGIGLSSILYGAFKTPTVQEWLGLIANADLMLTNAFHGTAFAAIFNTPFYAFVSGDSNNRMNTRLYDILSYLGLENRLINLKDKKGKLFLRVNFTGANKKANRFRQESLKWLANSINDS